MGPDLEQREERRRFKEGKRQEEANITHALAKQLGSDGDPLLSPALRLPQVALRRVHDQVGAAHRVQLRVREHVVADARAAVEGRARARAASRAVAGGAVEAAGARAGVAWGGQLGEEGELERVRVCGCGGGEILKSAWSLRRKKEGRGRRRRRQEKRSEKERKILSLIMV